MNFEYKEIKVGSPMFEAGILDALADNVDEQLWIHDEEYSAGVNSIWDEKIDVE